MRTAPGCQVGVAEAVAVGLAVAVGVRLGVAVREGVAVAVGVGAGRGPPGEGLPLSTKSAAVSVSRPGCRRSRECPAATAGAGGVEDAASLP